MSQKTVDGRNGVLALATANDTLEIVVPEGARPGTYVLASATGGITGTFDTVTKNVPGGTIVQGAATITYTVSPAITTILVR